MGILGSKYFGEMENVFLKIGQAMDVQKWKIENSFAKKITCDHKKN